MRWRWTCLRDDHAEERRAEFERGMRKIGEALGLSREQAVLDALVADDGGTEVGSESQESHTAPTDAPGDLGPWTGCPNGDPWCPCAGVHA